MNIIFLQTNQNQNRYYNVQFANHQARENALTNIIFDSICTLKHSTISISVAIFDACLSLQDFPESAFCDIARESLKIAININNDKESYLKYIKRSAFTNPLQRVCFEHDLLNLLQKPLYLITSFHFLEKFLKLEGISMQLPANSLVSFLDFKDFNDLVLGLNLIVLKNYESNQFTSLAIAVSVISMARYFCGAKESLPKVLQEITGIGFEDIYLIRQLISCQIRLLITAD